MLRGQRYGLWETYSDFRASALPACRLNAATQRLVHLNARLQETLEGEMTLRLAEVFTKAEVRSLVDRTQVRDAARRGS